MFGETSAQPRRGRHMSWRLDARPPTNPDHGAERAPYAMVVKDLI